MSIAYKDDSSGEYAKSKNLILSSVVGSTTWQPTMILRWLETNNYDPVNDDFEKVLQQKWQGNTGDERWEDIEVHKR